MTYHLLLGFGFAFAAGVQPGPLQAFLFTRALGGGWRATWPAAFAPLLSDAPIALLALLLLHRLPPSGLHVLRAAGGLLLLGLGWSALSQWRRGTASESRNPGASRTLMEGVLVNFLNPNPYLGWALVLGPAVLKSWQAAPTQAIALVVTFYGTMTLVLMALILGMSQAGRLPLKVQRGLMLGSSLVLLGLGAAQLGLGLWALRA